jgi:hypothetical protein
MAEQVLNGIINLDLSQEELGLRYTIDEEFVVWAKKAIACLAIYHSHDSGGTILTVKSNPVSYHGLRYILVWTMPVGEELEELNNSLEELDATEAGAIAISFALIQRLTDYNCAKRSALGTGIDYYLGYTKSHPKYVHKNNWRVAMEVGGTLRGGKARAKEYYNSKLKRIHDYGDKSRNTYIVIVSFEEPLVLFHLEEFNV